MCIRDSSFIFFTAFAFLNMVIGIIVNVLEQERRKLAAETEEVHHDQYMEALVSLREEMKDIKTLLKKDLWITWINRRLKIYLVR